MTTTIVVVSFHFLWMNIIYQYPIYPISYWTRLTWIKGINGLENRETNGWNGWMVIVQMTTHVTSTKIWNDLRRKSITARVTQFTINDNNRIVVNIQAWKWIFFFVYLPSLIPLSFTHSISHAVSRSLAYSYAKVISLDVMRSVKICFVLLFRVSQSNHRIIHSLTRSDSNPSFCWKGFHWTSFSSLIIMFILSLPNQSKGADRTYITLHLLTVTWSDLLFPPFRERLQKWLTLSHSERNSVHVKILFDWEKSSVWKRFPTLISTGCVLCVCDGMGKIRNHYGCCF